MPVYTTYLAKLKNDPKMPERIGSCFVYVVTTKSKENQCVAPDWSFLNEYKEALSCCYACHEEAWKKYEEAYFSKIRNLPEAQDWMMKRAWEAIIGNILLVCYEKSNEKCHRRLLAEEITKFTIGSHQVHAEYRGDFHG